jgi:hypothetical protein
MAFLDRLVDRAREAEIIGGNDEALQRLPLAAADCIARGSNRPPDAMTKSR